MSRIQSHKIKINGKYVRYYTGGKGEPLVVVHGGGDDASSWLKNLNVLAERYTVYAPDLPGFGETDPLDGGNYIPEYADFVEMFADMLGLSRYYLMGHSIGGGVALHCALKSPHKIKKLVLISSLCLGREIALWIRIMTLPARLAARVVLALFRAVSWLVKKLLIPVQPVLPRPPTSFNLGRNISTFKEQTLVLAHRLSEVVMPTLVVWGARDEVVPVQHAYAAAREIPDCQLKVFANRGHNVHRDELKEFSSLLNRFLG